MAVQTSVDPSETEHIIAVFTAINQRGESFRGVITRCGARNRRLTWLNPLAGDVADRLPG